MKRYQKILLGLVAAAILIIGSIQLYFSFSLDAQLKETLTTRFHEATNDAYELEIGNFDLEILGRQLNLSDVSLTQKKKTGNTEIHATLDALNISGIGFLKLLWDRKLTLRELELVNPTINFTTAKTKSNSADKDTSTRSLSQRLSEVALQVLNKVTIPSFQVRGLSVEYNRSDLPVQPYLSFQNSYIHLRDIAIDSTSLKDKRVLPSDDITTTFRDIRYHTPNELYELSVEQVDLSSNEKKAGIQSLKLTPRFNKEQFTLRVGHEVDHIKLAINQINWEAVDFDQLNNARELIVRQIQIENPDIDIFRDKRPPFPPNNRPPLPQQMIRNIPFPINVDSLTISEGNIRYTERQPKADEEGYIEFADLSASLKYLTNIEEQWNEDRPTTLTAKTDIMDRAMLQAHFTFPMQTNVQHIRGNLNSMDMEALNEAIVPLAFVRIDKGRILGMNFEMNLTEQRSNGELTLLYEDLKISLLDKESNKETFGNKVTSLLANTFKVKSGNTGDDPRVGTIEFERNKQKSVFNYWWKSLLSGLKASIGV